MITLKRENGKHVVTTGGESFVFGTLGEALKYIGGLCDATKI